MGNETRQQGRVSMLHQCILFGGVKKNRVCRHVHRSVASLFLQLIDGVPVAQTPMCQRVKSPRPKCGMCRGSWKSMPSSLIHIRNQQSRCSTLDDKPGLSEAGYTPQAFSTAAWASPVVPSILQLLNLHREKLCTAKIVVEDSESESPLKISKILIPIVHIDFRCSP